MLSFSLLGHPTISQNESPLKRFRSQKEAALLIYLAHTGKAHSRPYLADLLWDTHSASQSLSNLRTVLTRLRKKVGDALLITRSTVALKPEMLRRVDSANLMRTLAAVGEPATFEQATALQETLKLYAGEFLAGFDLPDAPQFEQWLTETREHIRRQVLTAYERVAHCLLTAGESDIGIQVARSWLAVDELDEAAHTTLIQLLLEAGNLREATAHYDRYAALLRRELDSEPSASLTNLIRQVRSQVAVNLPRVTAVSRHNLPPFHDQFFGRKTAQQEIHTRLDQPWCRLVTITGQGGVGKTRLATTVARSRMSQYPDGVWLVALENIDEDDEDVAEAIAVEIATMLDMRLTGSATPVEQLLNHLQHKQMLLVLDNFEHLLEGAPLVLDIVQRCDKVQLIVTSREALRLRAEWAIALTGLGYPSSSGDQMQSDAVELFVARQAQQRRGELAEEELTAVRHICHLVQGHPLAIELAAALTRHSTCQAVADSLRQGFDLLATSLRDAPQRHRSLQVVFEMSWQALTPELQQQLARISIFRGGFEETAVSPITHATPSHLADLGDKSLLTFHPENGRYTLHPVIRAYAAAKRADDDPTPHKHAHYYLTLLAQHTEPLQKKRPQKSMHLLEPDIDNIRQAWQTGLSAQNGDLLFNALSALSIYYQLRGLAHEGEAVMHTTLSTATDWGDECAPLVIRAGLERARFQNRLGQYRSAIQTIQTTLKLAEQCGDRWAEGMGHVWWGESLWRQGQYDTAKQKLNHALTIGHALNATLIIGWCHHQLGIIHDIQGRYDAAHDHLEEACTVWQQSDHARYLSVSLNSIGVVYRNQGDFPAAKQAMERALAICEQHENRYLEAMLLNNLSSLLINYEDYFGAQYYLQLGLELARSTGSLASQSDIFINMGENYRLQAANELAIQNFETGLKLAETIGNVPSIAEALCKLADIKKIQGETAQAETLYNQALTITRNSNLKSLECEILLGLTELFNDIDSAKAKEYRLEAAPLAKTIGRPNLLKRIEAINRDLSSK